MTWIKEGLGVGLKMEFSWWLGILYYRREWLFTLHTLCTFIWQFYLTAVSNVFNKSQHQQQNPSNFFMYIFLLYSLGEADFLDAQNLIVFKTERYFRAIGSKGRSTPSCAVKVH